MIQGGMIGVLAAAKKLAAISTVLAAVAAPVPSPSPGCDALPRPTVELAFQNNPPVQHNEKSVTELASVKIDTTFSHSINETFMLTGAAVSKFNPMYNVQFTSEETKDGHLCIAPTDINISVAYVPQIYIAREATVGSCDYNVILQHEVRHVNTDILTFNEYLPQLKSSMEGIVDAMPAAGPIDPLSRDQVSEALLQQIQTAFTQKIIELNKVRFNRQQMIDTRQEYLRTSHACPADSPLNTALAGKMQVTVSPDAMPGSANASDTPTQP